MVRRVSHADHPVNTHQTRMVLSSLTETSSAIGGEQQLADDKPGGLRLRGLAGRVASLPDAHTLWGNNRARVVIMSWVRGQAKIRQATPTTPRCSKNLQNIDAPPRCEAGRRQVTPSHRLCLPLSAKPLPLASDGLHREAASLIDPHAMHAYEAQATPCPGPLYAGRGGVLRGKASTEKNTSPPGSSPLTARSDSHTAVTVSAPPIITLRGQPSITPALAVHAGAYLLAA